MANEKFRQTVRIVLKLSQGQRIILKEGKFSSLESLDLSSLNNCLTREPDMAVYPLFGRSATNQEQPSSGEEPPDLSRYYEKVPASPSMLKALPASTQQHLDHSCGGDGGAKD